MGAPLLLGLVLLAGVGLGIGAVTVYGDQRSGTAGTAKVSDCEGGRKYDPGIRCTGTWRNGDEVVVGRVEGAGYGDVGKTIDVRVHGSDHATKPALGTPLMLGGMGAGIVAFAAWGLVAWWRRDPAARAARR